MVLHASFYMVLLHFKIVMVLLWFQKCNVTAQNPADLTALGIQKRLFTASMLKHLWIFRAVCQSLFSGNAAEKLNRHSFLRRSLVLQFRSIFFLEDMLGLPQKRKERCHQISMHQKIPLKNGVIFQDRKQHPVLQLLSSEKFCIICINQLGKQKFAKES